MIKYSYKTEKSILDDVRITKSNKDGMYIYNVGSAKEKNIYILKAIVYNKPFGMSRKYIHFNKMFRDYNESILKKDDGIVQTTNI